jgi:hypothetical protein
LRKGTKRRLESLKRIFEPHLAGPLVRPKSLDIAAEVFGVDLSDDQQRELLLFALAELSFGKSKAGRKRDSKAWTDQKFTELALLDEEFRYAQISDTKIANEIFKKHKEFHSAEVIRRRLPEARLIVEMIWEKLQDHAEPPEGWEEEQEALRTTGEDDDRDWEN